MTDTVSGKITTVPRLFSEHSLQNEKQTSDNECTHQMDLWSSISSFRDEIVSYK